LKLVGTWHESADVCNNAAWPLVRDPGRAEADYQRGLRLAKAACRIKPSNVVFRKTMGVAQYRCGLFAEALASLTVSIDLDWEQGADDLAFLTLVQHRLGQTEKARATLKRLRELMKNPDDYDHGTMALLREAESIELDQVFPADPFAH
jgi:tetratricopeptide (TPR) repeat protein